MNHVRAYLLSHFTGSTALLDVVTYHGLLRVVKTDKQLLKSSPFHTVYAGGSVARGVNSEGLFVKGEANETPSSITRDGIRGHRWVIYPIDSLLERPGSRIALQAVVHLRRGSGGTARYRLRHEQHPYGAGMAVPTHVTARRLKRGQGTVSN